MMAIISSFKICISAVRIIFMSHSFHRLRLTQQIGLLGLHSSMMEHCSANVEAMGSHPVEVPKNVCGFICKIAITINATIIFIQNLYFDSSHHRHDLRATASTDHFTNNVRLSELCELACNDYLLLLFY